MDRSLGNTLRTMMFEKTILTNISELARILKSIEAPLFISNYPQDLIPEHVLSNQNLIDTLVNIYYLIARYNFLAGPSGLQNTVAMRDYIKDFDPKYTYLLSLLYPLVEMDVRAKDIEAEKTRVAKETMNLLHDVWEFTSIFVTLTAAAPITSQQSQAITRFKKLILDGKDMATMRYANRLQLALGKTLPTYIKDLVDRVLLEESIQEFTLLEEAQEMIAREITSFNKDNNIDFTGCQSLADIREVLLPAQLEHFPKLIDYIKDIATGANLADPANLDAYVLEQLKAHLSPVRPSVEAMRTFPGES